ncbi:PrsW family intramembrane metalloprotease [Candidatus Gracilibacteria bacterium]|nr:PrsW family intramembrane metalloprotease [Candidatus Gracilibacteria bacterium]
MFYNVFLAFLGFFVILFPVYLWGYGTTLVLGYGWQRMRFLMGIIVGSISVMIMFFLEKYAHSSNMLLTAGFILVGLLCSLYVGIRILTYYGSPFARVFLRRIALGHIILIFLVTLGLLFFASIFPSMTLFVGLSFAFLTTSLFEEASKHLVSIGLAGQDFKFSKSDILTFTLFSVLGFVFCENIFYLFYDEATLGQWLYRSLFTLVAHIVASSLCAYYWWKALSYELFSVKYIGYFVLGFLLASGLHTLYNLLLQENAFLGLISYIIIGYMTLIILFAKK